jgi:hypothetical protein
MACYGRMINSVGLAFILRYLFSKLTYPPTANLVLEDTIERIYHENAFAEHWHGLFLIRGENVVLLGEIVSFLSSLKNF